MKNLLSNLPEWYKKGGFVIDLILIGAIIAIAYRALAAANLIL